MYLMKDCYIQSSFKDSYNSTIKRQKPQQWASELNTDLTKEEIGVASKHTKECTASLLIKETQTTPAV